MIFKMQPRPSHPPTNGDWLQYKSIITILYINDDLPLASLIKHMDQIYHFRATSNMYKKRLLAWNVRKNYRRAEKEAVLAHIEEQGEVAAERLELHGRRILLGRVRRYEREERNHRMTVPVVVLADASPMLQQNTDPSSKGRQRRVEPKDSFDCCGRPNTVIRAHRRLEHVLYLTETLYDDALLREAQWHNIYHPSCIMMSQRETSRDTRSSWPPAAWVDIGLALQFLTNLQSALAFWYLNRACQEIGLSLSQDRDERPVEFHALADVVDLFCDPTWDRFPDVRKHLMLYLISLSRVKEGAFHPMTMLWQIFADRHALLSCRDVLQRRLNQGFERRIAGSKVTLKTHYIPREQPRLLYGHSQWRWCQRLIE